MFMKAWFCGDAVISVCTSMHMNISMYKYAHECTILTTCFSKNALGTFASTLMHC